MQPDVTGLEALAMVIAASRAGRRRLQLEAATYNHPLPRRRCAQVWPLQPCELTRQQRRAAERGEPLPSRQVHHG